MPPKDAPLNGLTNEELAKGYAQMRERLDAVVEDYLKLLDRNQDLEAACCMQKVALSKCRGVADAIESSLIGYEGYTEAPAYLWALQIQQYAAEGLAGTPSNVAEATGVSNTANYYATGSSDTTRHLVNRARAKHDKSKKMPLIVPTTSGA